MFEAVPRPSHAKFIITYFNLHQNSSIHIWQSKPRMDLMNQWLKNEGISLSHLCNARQSVVGAWIRWRFRWYFLWDFVHVGLETNVKFLTRASCFCCYNFFLFLLLIFPVCDPALYNILDAWKVVLTSPVWRICATNLESYGQEGSTNLKFFQTLFSKIALMTSNTRSRSITVIV